MNQQIIEKIDILVKGVLEVENRVRTQRERRLGQRIKHQDTRQSNIGKKINRLRKQKISSEDREKRQRQLKKQHRDTLSKRGLI